MYNLARKNLPHYIYQIFLVDLSNFTCVCVLSSLCLSNLNDIYLSECIIMQFIITSQIHYISLVHLKIYANHIILALTYYDLTSHNRDKI